MLRKILDFIERNFLALCTYALVFIAGYSGNPWAAICVLCIAALITESEKE